MGKAKVTKTFLTLGAQNFTYFISLISTIVHQKALKH